MTIAVVEPGAPLTDDERRRYLRQLVLPQIGELGQRRLKNARVLIAGAGGLGAPVLMSLAGAGVGRLLIADADTVEISNLPRQLAFTDAEVGTPKALAAVETVGRLNPFVSAAAVTGRIDADTAAGLVAQVDLVLDGTDDAATRVALHDAAWERASPMCGARLSEPTGWCPCSGAMPPADRSRCAICIPIRWSIRAPAACSPGSPHPCARPWRH
jgi:Dinucleotide-utilizing enzymes involved in molybdopterin and thiamine biosynthesis family 2